MNHANFAETTLAAPITTTGETSIAVTSETSFPAVDFIISIDTEAMLVTTVAGTTWTVTRGYEGSTAATHLNGTAIFHDWSAGEADAVALKAGATFTGAVETADHGTAATDQVVNVCYGIADPPAANTTTEGALFIKYTA